MYRINLLNRNSLITPEEVIAKMASDQDVDARQILQNIEIAEERFIANIIGNKFYEDLIAKKNKKVTDLNKSTILDLINGQQESNNLCPIYGEDLKVGMIINATEFWSDAAYLELWERFLWKLTSECVDYMTIVPSWLRHTSSGQMLNNPKVIGASGASSGDSKDIQFKMTSFIQDRIDPLTERMHLWICERKSSYPLYGKECPSCDQEDDSADGISHRVKTNIILGLYDEN